MHAANAHSVGASQTQLGRQHRPLLSGTRPVCIAVAQAAKALGIYEDDPWLESAKKVNMMGVEGKKQNMPIIRMSMDICGFTEVFVQHVCVRESE